MKFKTPKKKKRKLKVEDDILYEILIENIQKVKNNLDQKRDLPIPYYDKKTREKFQRSKRFYKQYLSDYL